MADRKNGVIIRGVSNSWSNEMLEEAMSFAGPIVDVFIKDTGGRRRGYAFVTFANAACVAAAIAEAPATIGDEEVTVEARTAPQERKVADASENIYIKGLQAGTTEEEVQEVAASFGAVVSLDVSADRGFAFVSFETVEEASLAVNSQPLMLGGAEVQVEFRMSRARGSGGRKGRNAAGGGGGGGSKRTGGGSQREANSVYLKGVPGECDDGAIVDALAGYGACVSVSHRRGKDFAFAAFDSPEEMDAAVGGGTCSVEGIEVVIEGRNAPSE